MKHCQRSILVTGAGSGLGRGLCVALAEIGHSIIATDLSFEAVEETARQIRSSGGAVRPLGLDVTSSQSIQDCMMDLEGTPIDVLLNNAGLQHVASVDEFSVEKWDLLMNVMLRGPFLMSQAVLPEMKRQGFGRLIHVGSIHSLIASPYKSAYVAAKHGLVGFSKVLSLETASLEITSNVICPGYLRTPLVEAQIQDQARTRGISVEEVIEKVMLAPMPKKAFITIEEVVAAVEYLMSPLAKNVTGQTITIDGGWTAQ